MALVAIVGGSKTQREIRALAEQSYTSTLFQKSRAYAVAKCERWFILSPRYGLLEPTQLIDRDNITLEALSTQERFIWAQTVMSQFLRQNVKRYDLIVFLAYNIYRHILVPKIEARHYRVVTPLAGLNAIEQVKWLEKAAT